MTRTRDQILEERRQLKKEYGELFDKVAEILFRRDPAHVNFEVNPDEYDLEAGMILPRLKSCSSVDDTTRAVHEVLVYCFGPVTPGPEDGYREIATEIWNLW